MTPRQRARARLATAQTAVVQATELARRYPGNTWYGGIAKRAIGDLRAEIKAAETMLRTAGSGEVVHQDDAQWLAFWMEAGRRKSRQIKQAQREAGMYR